MPREQTSKGLSRIGFQSIARWLWPTATRAPVPHNLPYRPDIDGLRAFAVAAVVIFHIRPGLLGGGFVGVDIFFVISGTLITSLILHAAQGNKFSFADFYSRRVRRILPAFLLVLSAVLAVGWFTLLPSAYASLNKTALSSLFFVPNFQLLSEAGYFEGEPNRRILLHLWSLGVEEQFYLVWPVVVLLCWKRRLLLATTILGVSSLVGCLALSRKDPALAFYLPFTRFWELLAGAVLAWRERRHLLSEVGETTELKMTWRNMFSLVGACLVLAALFLTDPTKAFPSWRALPPVLGTALLIAAGPDTIFNRFALSNRPTVWLGQISYPLYLWHWPVFSYGWLLNGGFPPKVTLAFSVGLAAATYQFIEKPVRRIRDKRAQAKAALLLVFLGMAIGCVCATIIVLKGAPHRFPPAIARFLTYKYDDTTSWNYACFLQQDQQPEDWTVSRCVDPAKTKAQPLVVLWGDSHAAELAPGFNAVKLSKSFRLGEMTAAGCPPVLSVTVDRAPNCDAMNKFYMAEIRKLKPRSVVLAGYWYEYKFGFAPLADTIRALKSSGIESIIVIGPTTRWTTYLPELLAKQAIAHGGQPPATLGSEAYVLMPEADIRRLAVQEGAEYLSALDILCPGGQCITRLGPGPESVTYFDESHLTVSGSKYLVSHLQNAIPGLR
jgi:peptidoglycan/LPS O-acetylase OafA/YrhL